MAADTTSGLSVPGYEVGAVRRGGWAGRLRQGRHLASGRQVTLQEVRPELAALPGLVDRLTAFARRATGAQDPRLLAVLDLVQPASGLVVVAEWSDGPTLAEARAEGTLGASAAVAVLDRLLSALEAMADVGLVHGHIEEGTVLVDDGRVRLAELAVCAAANPAGDIAGDVRDAARMTLSELRRSGRQFDRVRHLLEAVAEGRGTGSPAALRHQLAAAALASLGNGWNDRAHLLGISAGTAAGPTAPPPAHRRRRHRRLVWIGLPVLVAVVAAAAVVAFLLTQHGNALRSAPAPLSVGPDATLSAAPASAGCDTTFVFHATGSLSGAGTLVYRWEQSDGNRSTEVQQRVSADQGGFHFVESWRLQGTQSVNGSMTLHILKPTDRVISHSFRYRCP